MNAGQEGAAEAGLQDGSRLRRTLNRGRVTIVITICTIELVRVV